MTPETDAAVKASNGQWSFVLKETCQRLERERDEWAALCGQYKAERDEAREALEYIAHSGLSARHIEDYAKEFLRRKEAAK